MKIETRYFLSNGLKLLQQNRKRLLVPAILYAFFGFLISNQGWIPINVEPLNIVSVLRFILLMIVGTFLSSLAYIGVFLTAKECLDSSNSSLLAIYKQAFISFWPVLGYSFLLSLILTPIWVLFTVLFFIAPYYFLQLVIIVTGILIGIVVFSSGFLLMISVITDFQSAKHLRRIIKMTKNYFVPVMLIINISYPIVLLVASLVFLQTLELSRPLLMIKDILTAFVYMFFIPYSAFVQIPLYRELKERINNVDSNQQHIVNEQI